MIEATIHKNLLDWAEATTANSATILGACKDFICNWNGSAVAR